MIYLSDYIRERNKYWTVYPENIDYRMSRRLGRKIPLDFAVENPSLDELITACRILRIPVVVEKDKYHPSNWIEKKGRIKIPKLSKISKRKLLKLIAHRIKLLRERKITIKEDKKRKSQVDKMLKRIIG